MKGRVRIHLFIYRMLLRWRGGGNSRSDPDGCVLEEEGQLQLRGEGDFTGVVGKNWNDEDAIESFW